MSPSPYPRHPCPKCNRSLAASGELLFTQADGESATIPVYQCDECDRQITLLGAKVEVALTFAVAQGRAFDPADPDTPFVF